MNPAYSVIFFSTGSGAGYGLMIWLAIAYGLFREQVGMSVAAALVAWGLSLLLITAGLLSSTAHLGHPERAWRALSQWRSSWLSREGVAAVLSYGPMLLLGLCIWREPASGLLISVVGLTIGLALLTVACTGMIYASLKPIPAWDNPWVVPGYLAFCLATGGALLLAITAFYGLDIAISARVCASTVALAWIIKLGYWRQLDHGPARATAGSATGLSEYGLVQLLESPHTADNYLLKEMGFRIARRHAEKLRRIALIGGIATLSLVMAAPRFDGPATFGWTLLGALTLALSVLIERWLFFAEARHAVTLYYGQSSV